MKRLTFLIALVVILAGFSVSGMSDTDISLADSNIPHTDLTTSQTEAGNSSASAAITITMTGVINE